MKNKLIWLLFVISLVVSSGLLVKSVNSQGGRLTSDPIVISGSGRPIGGINVSICQPIATTAATANGSLVVYTMASNPITAGYKAGATILVSGFTGGDTVFNVGSLNSSGIVSGLNILAVSATTITATASYTRVAGTNGTVLQQGNTTTSCAGLSTIYSDATLGTTTTNPIQTDGLGNYGAGAQPGVYYAQMYGSAIPTTLRQIVIPCVPGASNCAGTVAGTITSNQVAFGCGVNTICGSNSILWTASGNSGTFLLANTTPATNLANQNSPLLIVQGSEWNGASAVNDTWTIQNILGAGSNTTSTLVFSHAGAPINGVTTLFPGAVNTGIASGVSGSFGMFGAASGFAGWTVSGVAGSPHLISMPTADPAQSGYLLAGFVGNPTGTLWIPPSVFMYCGATSGATQNCTQTVQSAPLTVHGDVTLNTATTQSIGNLPFTAATYSCSGSDLTTVTGIVNFNTYANGSVVISESGGTNTDHLRYICVGN